MSNERKSDSRSDNVAAVGFIAIVFVPLLLVHLIADILVKSAGW